MCFVVVSDGNVARHQRRNVCWSAGLSQSARPIIELMLVLVPKIACPRVITQYVSESSGTHRDALAVHSTHRYLKTWRTECFFQSARLATAHMSDPESPNACSQEVVEYVLQRAGVMGATSSHTCYIVLSRVGGWNAAARRPSWSSSLSRGCGCQFTGGLEPRTLCIKALAIISSQISLA